jgi:hypothetical protein
MKYRKMTLVFNEDHRHLSEHFNSILVRIESYEVNAFKFPLIDKETDAETLRSSPK